MAKAHGKKARVYVTGVDLSTYLKGATSGGQVDLADSTGLAADDKEFVVGMGDGKLALDGMFTAKGKTGVSQLADVLEAAFGVSPLVGVHLPQGDGFGNKARLIEGNQSSVQVTTPFSDVGKLAGEIMSNVGFANGASLRAKAETEEGEGEGESLDGAASSETGGLGVLQVFALSEGQTLDVKIQHSADDETYADLITFTTAETGEVAEAKALAAAAEVKRYTRITWELSGGAATFHASFARN